MSQYLQPLLWLHYINEIFFIWTHGKEKIVQFLNKLNNLHLNLSFIYETSIECYIKPTDGHQSSHPRHINVSIPYSQALRSGRICSSEKYFRAHICQMKNCFWLEITQKKVNNQIDKVVFSKNSPVKKSSENGLFSWLHTT